MNSLLFVLVFIRWLGSCFAWHNQSNSRLLVAHGATLPIVATPMAAISTERRMMVHQAAKVLGRASTNKQGPAHSRADLRVATAAES